jgi:TolB-like protein/DNA-binding winged helix-turn-helix (wHTH) protein
MIRRKISFDGWVLDRETGDLTRDGQRQRLQELPLKVLDLLLASPGALVTREQLIAHLWPKGVVDFDTGLNTAVRKLRVALGDLADAPKYIETIPRRGYRFLGTVDPEPVLEIAATPESIPASTALPASAAADLPPSETAGVAVERRKSSPVKPRSRLPWVAASVLLACLGAAYWLSHRHAPPPAAPAAPPTASLPDKSVAVLPFESLSAEPNNEFIALGIAETVLNRLGGMRDLTVIARTSSFTFKNRNEDARQIGRALNARYLVEGSVQKAGERLRVQAQLVDATNAKQLWSLTFDRPLSDIFALQDEISSKLAEQFSASVAAGTPVPKNADTSHVDAYLAYLQGRSLIVSGKIADVRNSISSFERATRLDPKFAAAFAQLSHAISLLDGLQLKNDPEALRRAVALNDQALALDPQQGEAWVQRAALILEATNDKDSAGAEKAFKKGLALAPNYGQGFAEYAEFLWSQGRRDEAISTLERARQVDPLTARHHYLKGLLLDEMKGDYKEVEALYLQALNIDPTFHNALIRLGQQDGIRGEFARAIMLQERGLALEPEAGWVRGIAAGSYVSIDDIAAAEDAMRGESGIGSGVRICVLMRKGDHAAAAQLAYQFYDRHIPDVLTLPKACASAEILRDALATKHYDHAFRIFQDGYAIQTNGDAQFTARVAYFFGVPLARLMLAKGDSAGANRLLQSILTTNEPKAPDSLARTFQFMARSSAFAVLGDREQALEEFDQALRLGVFPIWMAMDRNPIYEPLHQDPRYQALALSMYTRLRKQAELVAAMRAKGELPMRPPKPSATTT